MSPKSFFLVTLFVSVAASVALSSFVTKNLAANLSGSDRFQMPTFNQATTDVPVASKLSDVETEVKKVAALANPSVVSIVVSKEMTTYRTDPFGFFYEPSGSVRRKVGGGTAFFVNKDGYLLTNKHVVADPNAEYGIILASGEELVAKVLAFDPTTDLAVVRAYGKDGSPYLKSVPLPIVATISDVGIGSFVLAIGNALAEFQNTLTLGVVSWLGRSIEAGSASTGEFEQLSGLIQTDAAINPGNSGGPLVDLRGRVVGINTAVSSGANGIGFAIPLSDRIVADILESVLKTGKIRRAYLGVRYASLTPDMAKSQNLSVTAGAVVTGASAVVAGSPADKAGIEEGDVIVEADGRPVSGAFGIKEALSEKIPGDVVRFKIVRWKVGDEKILSVEAELAER